MTKEQKGTRDHLIPCPCCGRMPRRWLKTRWLVFKSHFVECLNPECGLRTRDFRTAELADNAWNRRFNLAAPQSRLA